MGIEKKKVDEDWKRQAELDKQKIADSIQPPAEGGEGVDADQLEKTSPPFQNLMNQIALQAMLGLGQVEDPRVGGRTLDLPLAKQFIDQLGALEKRTQGRLLPDEEAMLRELLQTLRMTFVEMSRHQTGGAGPGGGGEGTPGSGAPPPGA